jgi:hypothetical protein
MVCGFCFEIEIGVTYGCYSVFIMLILAAIPYIVYEC